VCQIEYADDPRFCGQCGRPFAVVGAPDPVAKGTFAESMKMWAYVFAGGSILLLMLVLCSDGGSSSSRPSSPHSVWDAQVMCEDFARKQLRAPSTAKFGRASETTATHLGDGKYRVRTHVDAQNGFGAMIRSQVDCTVQWAGGSTWRLQNLEIL